MINMLITRLPGHGQPYGLRVILRYTCRPVKATYLHNHRKLGIGRIARENQKRENFSHLSTDISLASFLWYMGKQCRPRPDASDQGTHCLLTKCSIKIQIKMKITTTEQPLKRKWTDLIDNNEKFH